MRQRLGAMLLGVGTAAVVTTMAIVVLPGVIRDMSRRVRSVDDAADVGIFPASKKEVRW